MRHGTRAWLAMAAVAVAAAGECAPVPNAAGALHVSAVIPRHASIRMAPPASMTVSEADIARGYVEFPLEVMVESNLKHGYALVFERRGEHVRQVHVHGLDGAVLAGEASGFSARPAPGRGLWRELLHLRFRFDLAAGTRAGRHAWPLHISMVPL